MYLFVLYAWNIKKVQRCFNKTGDDKMDKILVIAGGKWQVPLIKKAKELGYEVVNSNLYEKSPGFEFADYEEVCDVRDKEKNLKFARKYDVKGVLSDQSDIAIPTVAYVAEKIGCNSIGMEMAELFTNKYKMREFCIREGFPCPEYKLCRKLEEAIEFFQQIKKRIIIKPLDSQSSRGVYTISSLEELSKNFSVSQSFSGDGKSVIVERYIIGKEFTIDGMSYNGNHHSLAVSEKAHFPYNHNIASELRFSYDNANYDYDELRQIHDQLIDRTGLSFGLTHAEYKYEDGKFFLIEMAARGGGTNIASNIVPYMSGIDTYEILIHHAMGRDNDKEIEWFIPKDYQKRKAVLKFLDVESKGKKIISITGIDDIKKIKGVEDFTLEFSAGDVVKHAQDDRSRVGYYIAYAESAEELRRIEEDINKLLVISYE